MILSEYIKIVVNSMDVGRLLEISDKYKNLHKGDIINIFVCELSKNSGRKIKVKCDICGKEKEISYAKYLKNIKNGDFYACSTICSQEKIKNTNFRLFGVDRPAKSEEIKEKMKKTINERYGCDNVFQNKDVKKKLKDISIKKYGVDNIFKSDIFKNNIKIYNFEKYGVYYLAQVPEFYMKQQKSGYRLHLHENTKLYYRGTYEKDFLDLCFENNILVEQGKRIKYIFENNDHYYFSDFYLKLKNLIVEIKSKYTYEKYLDKNLIKQKTTIGLGYNFMFIIDKNYEEFMNIFK